MSAKPSRWCGKCRKVHSGACPKNTFVKTMGTTVGQGRGGRPWRAKRKRIFERDNFLCQEHYRNGQLVPVELHGPSAGICDHIVCLAEGGSDDESNLETLCKPCSDKKTAEESARGRQKFRE